MATVSFEGIRKVYPNGVEAVSGIDLEVGDGEFLVIVGPSGCGKSTLLRMVAGLESITEGTLCIDGRVVNELEPKDRDIAMVFQNYALYPHMSVRQNMAYGLKNRGEPASQIKQKVEQTAEILELSQLLERKPNQLSGGQRQRVAMGRAMVRSPKVFLFDEPLSNLDAKLRVQMRVEIKRLQRDLGVTSIFVTHDQVEAMTLADRLVAMNSGVVEQIGPPMALYDVPSSLFVAEFIGSPPMNLLPAEIFSASNVAALQGCAKLGIRPESLQLGSLDDAVTLAGEAILTEKLGPEALVHVELQGGHTVVVRAQNDSLPELGETVQVSMRIDTMHRFDREGRRIDA